MFPFCNQRFSDLLRGCKMGAFPINSIISCVFILNFCFMLLRNLFKEMKIVVMSEGLLLTRQSLNTCPKSTIKTIYPL